MSNNKSFETSYNLFVFWCGYAIEQVDLKAQALMVNLMKMRFSMIGYQQALKWSCKL